MIPPSSVSRGGCAADGYCREFGGYETEATSGLLLAPARAYHPLMGMFLTHDPAGQYPNPYAYGPWNPVNGVDPTGAFFAELLAFIVSNAWWLVPVMSAAAVAIDVGIRTGSFGFALIAGLTTLATALATGWLMEQGLGLVAEVFGAQAKAWVKMALAVVQVPLGAYGAAQAADNGMVASAAVSAFLAALGAYALYRGLRGPGQGVKSQTQEEAKQSPGGMQFAENTNTNTATDAGSGRRLDTEENVKNLAKILANECGSKQCNEAERRAIGGTVLTRMLRNGTSSVRDVAGAYQGFVNGKQHPTEADFKLAAELLRAGGDPSGPTHFLSPQSLLSSSEPLKPEVRQYYFPKVWGDLGERWTPTWARSYAPVECAGCRWKFVVLYRQSAPGKVY
ncbi:MAG: hypothetical protein KatS3mg077_2617 [Candidatus Binatia bacterium]|nr:MAG: hypothetical protein KatS3mg077_2617 [Candidatus Binatia bacterium]